MYILLIKYIIGKSIYKKIKEIEMTNLIYDYEVKHYH